MAIKFTKYQGTGNDFVIIDNRDGKHSNLDVKTICDRKFGVGGDGLMFLENHEGYDFKMVYYNSDGAVSSMCGNGGRCLVHFAHSLNIFEEECRFIAIDGDHLGSVNGDLVSLKMNDVSQIENREDACILDTGSPHYIKFVNEMPTSDFASRARNIRMTPEFKEDGINVNFIKVSESTVEIRTFERGVEDETLSCGTGVTAASIAAHAKTNQQDGDHEFYIDSKGGKLTVRFNYSEGKYTNIWLIGPAKKVFTGEL